MFLTALYPDTNHFVVWCGAYGNKANQINHTICSVFLVNILIVTTLLTDCSICRIAEV